eukprot:1157203-Pelagomonas_calceolata.AAC.10
MPRYLHECKTCDQVVNAYCEISEIKVDKSNHDLQPIAFPQVPRSIKHSSVIEDKWSFVRCTLPPVNVLRAFGDA